MTPFYIFGWVHYENDAECYNPIVKVANLNTSESWRAESSDNSSFFQLIITNINDSDKLEFNVTNGIVCNTTSHEVKQTEMNNSGIFYFNLTLPVPALTINIELTPDDDPSTHGIQVINSDPNTNKTVTIIANVTDLNGYENITNVTANITGPSKVDGSPVSLNFVSNVSAATAIYRGTFNMSNYSEGKYEVEVRATDAEGTGIDSKKFTYLTMLSPAAPRIVSYAPQSPVSDFEGATRTFNITIDQMMIVSWRINGTEVFNQTNVNESAYTNTSAAIGTWNVSAIVSNANGTAMQTWIWTVSQQVAPTPSPSPTSSPSPYPSPTPTPTPTPTPPPTNFTAPSSPFYIFGSVHYKNGKECNSPFVVVTNLNTSEELIAENRTESDFYQLVTNPEFVNASDILRIEASKNGMPVGNATHIVTTEDIFRGVIKVNINEGPDLVISESGVSIPPLLVNKTNEINVTVWNNGTAAASPVNVSFFVSKGNETEYENETRITDSLQPKKFINVPFSWSPTSEGSYNITVSADYDDEIKELNESNNNLTMTVFVGVPDFNVTGITFNTTEPLIGDIIEINATIANLGTEGEASVEFYDNKSIKIERGLADYFEKPINDSLILPDVKRIRVHFVTFDVPSDGYIKIYNESQLEPVEELKGKNTSYWTGWCDGDTIRIESWNVTEFKIDRYEAVLLNESISLDAGDSAELSVDWNLSDQYMGWAILGGHNITVRVDPYNQVIEYNESNNEKTEAIDVNASQDFAVVKISLNNTEPVLGKDVVGINVTVKNFGVRNGTTSVMIYYDNMSVGIERKEDRVIRNESESYTSTDNISLPPNVLGARLHFDGLCLYNGHIDICDGKGHVVERFYDTGFDTKISVWTDWIYSRNITVKIVLPYNPHMCTHRCRFKIDEYEALIKEENVTLNASEWKIINASWRTGARYGGARNHSISACIDPHDVFAESNEANNTLSEQVFVNGTDLTVTDIKIPCGREPDFCYCGQHINITVTIANLGVIDAHNFTVLFKDGMSKSYYEANTSGITDVFNPSEIFVLTLHSGENTTINVTWTPAESGIHTIAVNIPFDIRDNNETNNELYTIHKVAEPEWDFSVENVSVYPREVREGEPVLINATIGNHGHKSGNVSVGFFVNCTDFAGSKGERFVRIGTVDDVFVPVNKTINITFNWTANVHGGEHLVVAVADPDEEIPEIEEVRKLGDSIIFRGNDSVTGNNVKKCSLHVIGPDLAITNLTLDPAAPNSGDIVNISVEIENKGSTPANSTVWFYIQSNESIDGETGLYYDPKWNWLSALQPEDVPMRFHFDYIKIYKGGSVNAFVTDSKGQCHTVYFYVKEAGQEVKESEINFNTPYDEYLHGGGDTCTNKSWDDTWTEWTKGTAVEIYANSGYQTYVQLLIDNYQVLLGSQTVKLNAGESKVYNITWNTTFPLQPGKNYTILAVVENQTLLSNETYLGGTDLAVTDISVEPGMWNNSLSRTEVWDGDLVWLNATITNFGYLNATEFEVSFYEIYEPRLENWYCQAHRKEINTTRVKGGLPAGNSTIISVPWNASIRDIICKCRLCPGCAWHDKTFKGVDDYTINVTIDLLENREQARVANNTLTTDVHVNRSRDFFVTNLNFSVNSTVCDPQDLELYDIVTTNATIDYTNLANQPGMVNLSFYLDEVKPEHEIGSTTVPFNPGNGTRYANITWKADNLYGDVYIPGDHNITVVVDPEGEIYEINESKPNNEFTWQIHVKAPELVFEKFNITPEPETLVKGDNAIINVTIANRGRLNTTRDFNLTIYEWAERHIDNVASNESYSGFPRIEIERANATAMRLYLDLEKEEPLLDPEIETVVRGGEVCIKDGKGEVIRCYNHSFHGWTPWIMDNKSVVETIKRMTINRYLFCWDNVSGSENASLIQFLTDEGVDWAENATINKTDDSRTIQIYAGNNSANLTLDVQNETVIFEINGTMVEDISLIVKEENGNLRIYKPEYRDTDIDTKVSKVYYFTQSRIINTNTTTRNFAINKTANITVEWTVPTDGEQFIVAKIDPEDVIMEYNEANNTFKQHVPVQAADLEVTNLSLTCNGTEIGENDTVRDNDTVRISANVTNVGIEEASDFSVYFLVDDIPIKNETILRLANGSSTLVNANWTAEVGKHVIKVEADYDDKINETNETNNIEALVRYVCGAEVSGNTSWETLGLHGLNGTILFDPTQPYDEDEVKITAVINNYGCVNATGFNVLLFYDYDPPSSREGWLNRSYPGANWTYLRIIDNARKTKVGEYDPMDAGDVKVYDASGNAVLNESNFNDTCNWTHVMEGKSCWIPVRGDTVNVYISRGGNENFSVSLYPIYQNGTSMLYEGINVPVNRSKILTPPMTRNVSVGNFTVMAVIDPENNVPEDEDNKTDNIISRIMRVLPTIDFTVLNVTNVTAEKPNLSDLDTADITAEVANIGYRNGTANVSITDYETENRTYRYHFDKSLNWSYLPTPPDTDLLKSGSGYDDVMVIRRPGVDAINVHLSNILIYKPDLNDNRYGSLAVCNESGVKIWNETANPKTKTIYIRHKDIRVSGETVYIYSVHASFSFDGYTTEKKWLEERDVPLNATKTWNESKNFTVKNWLATTGNHRINVTVWNNTTKEINETNNTFILPLEVNASRDPTVVNITFDPEHPEDGDNVTIIATVKNNDNSTKNATFMVDLWLTVTRNSSIAPIPDAEWAIQHKENRTSYIIHLGRENITLTPGNETTVNATWHNMNLSGDPLYVVTAIVDPLDEIDEINENQSDNELNKYLWMNYPDFAITKFNQPTRKEKNASVTIKNAGMKNASNVTVMFKLAKFSTYGLPLAEGGFGYPSLSHPGAFDLQLHFARLNATSGCLWLKKNLGDEDIVEEYCGKELYDVWTPWIDSDTVYIVYAGADFWIDEYKWGDVEYKTIDMLNASESKNVSLPERWSKYERPMMLDVWVDPEIDTADNKIGDFEEQNEGNNHRSGVIYADLVLRSVGTVFSEDGDLSGINATIWSDNTLEDGIAFPVCNFSVALKDRDTGRTLLTKRIGENGTIYGGEEREVIFNVSHQNSSELMLTPNRTYHFNVVVDSEDKPPYRAPGEIWEYDETNNEKPIDIGPDIVVDEIYTESLNDSSCDCIVGAVIRNEGNFRAENFSVRLHLNSTSGNITETVYENIPCLFPWGEHNETKLLFREVSVVPNHIYELVEVVADPENTVEELDEGNNEKETDLGPDIVVERFEVPRYLIVNHSADILVRLNNTGEVGAEGFDITLSPSEAYTNNTFDVLPHEVICLKPNGERLLEVFNWTVPAEGVYNFTLRADPEDDVEERDETNNNGSAFLKRAFADIGYRGDKLEPYKINKTVEGDVIFYLSKDLYKAWGVLHPNETGEVEWDIQIPAGATIEIARLYVYWGWSWRSSASGDVPACPSITMKFDNGNGYRVVGMRGPPPFYGNYTDYPVNATVSYGKNHAYGTYCYNVPVRNGTNRARLKLNRGVNETEIKRMGLLVVYRGGDETYTRYWIDEGADMLIGGPTRNKKHYTPLCPDETTTRVPFDECVEDFDKVGNATLITVVPFGDGGDDDVDEFFDVRCGGKWKDKKRNGLYFDFDGDGKFHYIDDEIADGVWGNSTAGIAEDIDEREVRDFIERRRCNMLFGIQDRGDFIMPATAILKVTYPPDLEPEVPTTLNANAGASYDIPITIHNWGRSKAKNFTVIVTIDGNEVYNELIPELKGGDSRLINIPKKAPAVEGIITHNVTVVVDPVDAGHPEGHVKELINSYRNGEDNNIWNDTVTVVVQSSGLPGPGGGGGTGGGWGTGTGTGTGPGSGTAKGVAGGTGQGGGESGGKTITGRLMKGVVVPGGEETGGGGKGGFSLLAWLIRLALLAAVGSLVCAGYLMERRRQNNKLSLQKRV
ncbi:MAG: hypothetical protein C4B56_04580 [Candidatus Methanophagaceae archaeon]|nr:MAG: hypothetical protein C4B56_04580 [Methanophagales archaeon]